MIITEPMEEYRNLTIRNSFMFAAVFSDHRLLAQLLARILPQEHIDPDSIVIKEKDDKAYYGSRGVRYDVFHTDGKHLFDVELQIRQDPFLFDRAVYNSSSMIMSQVHPGTDTYELTFKTYVIFICAYDVNHGKRLKQYTFKDEEGKKIRRNEALAKNYLVGNYGGIPSLKPLSMMGRGVVNGK